MKVRRDHCRRTDPTMRLLPILFAVFSVLPAFGEVAPGEAPAGEAPGRRVVITIDDLPIAGVSDDLRAAKGVTEAICKALQRHGAPASGFVTGRHVMVPGEVDARLGLLRQYRDCGVELENHGYSHRSFHDMDFLEYLDDAVEGGLFPGLLMREIGKATRFYRHPFNHAGRTADDRQGFDDFLSLRGLQLAPFTVEHADYLFDRVYRNAEKTGDAAAMAKIRQAYLDQLDLAFDFAETLSRDTFGREIPQIFLLHSNRINALELGHTLDRLAARGYRFISLSEALEDPAYSTANAYSGTAGINWLHRFRVGLGKENRLRDEPDPPQWMMDAYRALTP